MVARLETLERNKETGGGGMGKGEGGSRLSYLLTYSVLLRVTTLATVPAHLHGIFSRAALPLTVETCQWESSIVEP